MTISLLLYPLVVESRYTGVNGTQRVDFIICWIESNPKSWHIAVYYTFVAFDWCMEHLLSIDSFSAVANQAAAIKSIELWMGLFVKTRSYVAAPTNSSR